MLTFGPRLRIAAVALLYAGFVLAGVISARPEAADDSAVWLTPYQADRS